MRSCLFVQVPSDAAGGEDGFMEVKEEDIVSAFQEGVNEEVSARTIENSGTVLCMLRRCRKCYNRAFFQFFVLVPPIKFVFLCAYLSPHAHCASHQT